MFKYKTIEEIPYEDMTDELKERLDGDFELLTEDNIKKSKRRNENSLCSFRF